MKISHKLNLSVVITLLIITIPALTLLYILATDYYLTNTIASLKKSTQAHIAGQIHTIRRAETSLETLSIALKKSLQAPTNKTDINTFNRIMAQDELGVTRNKKTLFDGHTQAGIFIPKDVVITDKVKRIKIRAMQLLSSFGLSALQQYDGIWFDQLDKTSVIFWRRDPDFIYKLAPDHDYTQTLWDQLASPKLNPERIALWTPAIYESPVNTWVVSAVYPLDIAGQWQGILGHDIALTELLSAFRASEHYKNSQHFLLDGFGNYILAGFWQQALEENSWEFKPDFSNDPSLKKLLNQQHTPLEKNISHIHYITHNNQQYIAFSVHIEKLNWRYIRLVSVSELLEPVHQVFSIIAALLLISCLSISFFLSVSIRRMIVAPLLRLNNIAYQYGIGNLQQKAITKGNDELAQMGIAFNQMAHNINDSQQKLIQSEAHYKFVLGSIHEGVIITDVNNTILFSNEAFLNLMDNTRYSDTVGKNFIKMLDTNEQHAQKKAMESLWHNDENRSIERKLQLKTHSNGYLWVTVLTRIAYNNVNKKVLSSTIIDISHQIYIERSNWILSEAEKKTLLNEPLSHIAYFICQNYVDLFNFPLIIISLTHEDNSHKKNHISAGKNTHLVKKLTQDDKISTINQAFNTQETQISNEKSDFNNILSIPLIAKHTILGVISFQFKTHSHRNEYLIQLENLAQQIATIIGHAQSQFWLTLQNLAMENTANSIFITDVQGSIIWANKAYTDLTEYNLEDVWGQNPNELTKTDHQSQRFWANFWRTLKNKHVWHGEITNQTKYGKEFTVSQSVTPILNQQQEVTHYITVQEDITDKKEAEKHITHLVTHDDLTGLANHVLLTDYLKICIAGTKPHDEKVAILFLNLDFFKYINDVLGHTQGNEILKQTAHRLNNTVFDGDLVARLSSDEFVIVLNKRNLQSISHIANILLNKFQQPFLIAQETHTLTASIGIALYPEDGKDADTLLKNADAAMYHAKKMGKNNIQFFTQSLNESLLNRIQMEKDLKSAIENNQFILMYQPQISLKHQKVSGVESLIRWNHPEKKMISPAEFIPIAEESGLILPLGEWILETACKQMSEWVKSGIHPETISINLSSEQFNDPNLIPIIKKILTQTELEGHYLILELTESMMMTDVELHIKELNDIKKLGVKVSIDDFGTGYSSLSYLKSLPIDELKIDKSFIDDISSEETDQNIVRSIINLGHNLNLSIVAEGIEDSQQLQFLNDNDCDIIQGYYFSKPLPADQVSDFIYKYEKIAI